jgi:hypothetical protein
MEREVLSHETVIPTRLLHNFPDVHTIYTRIPLLNVHVRKELLTSCRVQQSPLANARLRKEMRLWYSTTYLEPSLLYRPRPCRFLDPSLISILSSPILSSFLSMALRAEHFPDDGTTAEVIQSSINKELAASIESRTPTINWDALFNSSNLHHMQPLIPNGPYRPYLYLYLRKRLLDWREKMADRVLVPQMSTKTMGLESSCSLHQCLPPSLSRKKMRKYSTLEAEQFYAENGYLPSGPCEMRLAWKFNDLKPRVYYAQGLSAYSSSRFVHDIFDSLQRVSHIF